MWRKFLTPVAPVLLALQIHAERAAIAADAAKEAPATDGVKPRRSILRRLLTERDEEGQTLSDEQAADNLLGLLFAGWVLICLSL
jgi:cytochrome P450